MKFNHKKTMKRHIYLYTLLLAAALLLLSSCTNHPDVPSSSKDAKSLPAIFPDYCNVTVPYNIAPLNFMLPADEYDECVARLTTSDGQQQTYGKGVKQKVIKEYRKAGYQRFTMKYDRDTDELKCVIDGKRFTDIATLAKNDGMTLEEFKDWFFGQGMSRDIYSGIIIHFTDFRYNSEQ